MKNHNRGDSGTKNQHKINYKLQRV